MAFVIFGDNFSFPEGNASTNRVYTYAKGLIENGVGVTVICFENEYVNDQEGITEGIRYHHPFGQTQRSKYLIIRRWQKFLKYFRAISLFRKISKSEKIDTIMVYTMRLSTHVFAWYLSKITGSKLVKECSEHPLIYYQKGHLKKIEGFFKLKIESRLCDGIFCISHFLVDFFKRNGVPQNKLFLIPSTVDPSRFSQNGQSPFPHPYIGYFGGLTFNRDNVDILIKSFALLTNNHPDLKLILGGFCSEKELEQIKNLIQDLNLASKVIVLEYLSRTEIIRYIVHSEILVMVRAKDLETQASFPSKLTEYMATSKPVVTVKVGEIPDYLTDGVDSFIVEPGNTSELAEKLDYILNNYDFALKIALNGKELTTTTFNYNFQAKRIIGFLETLN
ncbi:MAG TPA: glycosyltransferase family 4 protein [Bacteroidales bacterium]|nr:glycosyltransferase family 4 protein [Bacteroidales bacterium]